MPTSRQRYTAKIGIILMLAGLSSCTRLIPPASNVSTINTPQFLLELQKPTWIGVRDAGGFVGIVVLGTSFSEAQSVTCVYRKAKGGFVSTSPQVIELPPDVTTPPQGKASGQNPDALGRGQRCKARHNHRRLVAVVLRPGAGQQAPASTADGLICSNRCNRVHSRRHYMNIEVLAAEPNRIPDPPFAKARASDPAPASETAAGIANVPPAVPGVQPPRPTSTDSGGPGGEK